MVPVRTTYKKRHSPRASSVAQRLGAILQAVSSPWLLARGKGSSPPGPGAGRLGIWQCTSNSLRSQFEVKCLCNGLLRRQQAVDKAPDPWIQLGALCGAARGEVAVPDPRGLKVLVPCCSLQNSLLGSSWALRSWSRCCSSEASALQTLPLGLFLFCASKKPCKASNAPAPPPGAWLLPAASGLMTRSLVPCRCVA